MKRFGDGDSIGAEELAAFAGTPMSNRRPSSDNGLVEKLCGLVVLTLNVPPELLPLQMETRLHGAGLGLDSLDALRLVAALEEEFEITIDDTELSPSTFESISSIASLVKNKQLSSP